MIYPDTSVVVALFVYEPHSAAAHQMMSESTTRPWFTPLHEAEWEHAIAQNVRLGQASEREAVQWRGHLADDLAAGRWLLAEVPAQAWLQGAALARALGTRLPMRTLDTLHVTAAVELGAREFWTFDRRQAALAKRLGLLVRP